MRMAAIAGARSRRGTQRGSLRLPLIAGIMLGVLRLWSWPAGAQPGQPAGIALVARQTLFGGATASAAQEPTVLYSSRLFRMWYTRGAGVATPALAYATSADGLHWQQQGIVLGRGHGGVAGRVEHSTVVRVGTVYYCYFASDNNSSLWRATSPDGAHWSDMRLVLGQHTVPWATGWNNTAVWRTGGRWLMLAEYGQAAGPWLLALATSPDGLRWTFAPGDHPLVGLAVVPGGTTGGPWLVPPTRPGGLYALWYHASPVAGELPTDIYQASSADLRHWQPLASSPSLARRLPGEVDQVADPCMVESPRGRFLYYDGVDNPHSAFFVAVAVLRG